MSRARGGWMGPLEAGVAEVLRDAYESSGPRVYEERIARAMGLVRADRVITMCICQAGHDIYGHRLPTVGDANVAAICSPWRPDPDPEWAGWLRSGNLRQRTTASPRPPPHH